MVVSPSGSKSRDRQATHRPEGFTDQRRIVASDSIKGDTLAHGKELVRENPARAVEMGNAGVV